MARQSFAIAYGPRAVSPVTSGIRMVAGSGCIGFTPDSFEQAGRLAPQFDGFACVAAVLPFPVVLTLGRSRSCAVHPAAALALHAWGAAGRCCPCLDRKSTRLNSSH